MSKKINDLRPDKKKVEQNRDHAYGYVDALSDVIEIVKNNSHLHNVSLRFLEEKLAELRSEYGKGWSNEPDDDYKRHERLGMRIKALNLAKTELFTNVS